MKLSYLLCLTAHKAKAQGILVKEIVVTRTVFECPATTEFPQETGSATVSVANNSAVGSQSTSFILFLLLFGCL